MQSGKNKSDFLQLLLQNNENDIKRFLISKGKKPKAYCPIQFIVKENEVANEKKENK